MNADSPVLRIEGINKTYDDGFEALKNINLEINEGEIFVPEMKSYKVKDLASKISKKYKIIGLRPGEKMDEILISDEEKKRAKKREGIWIIEPYSYLKLYHT